MGVRRLREQPQIEDGAFLLRREEQAWLALGEFVDERGFSNAPSSVDDGHLEAVLAIQPLKCRQLAFSPNEHRMRLLRVLWNLLCTYRYDTRKYDIVEGDAR